MASYISADELASIVGDPAKTPGVDYLIVDARDEDYQIGHIPGAVNVPAHDIRLRAGKLIDKYRAVPLVVFHCALSQQRGPKSARIYSEIVQARLETEQPGSPLASQTVQVLRGGFVGWAERFRRTKPELIEDFDQARWDAM
ncbi:Cdc25 phosphatase Ibp1 [Coemansia nantahalensis]|uniref:Cdc25 phosphatase Ibp1 n=1 Tax=Coemansia nantahalensis TaxID=2789366 RepID=A0ACC1JL88_9FUNG|nr:Cdc25 phosphatase Ibp1 [Coemansia nantahalensis]